MSGIHIDREGGLVAIGQAPQSFVADQTIDAKDKWIVVNLCDVSARLYVPGSSFHDSLKHELSLAQTAGITQIIAKPDPNLEIDDVDQFCQIQQACADLPIQLAVCASLFRGRSEDQLSSHNRFVDFSALREVGCKEVAVPAGINYSAREIEKAMIIAQNLDIRLNMVALEPTLVGTGCCHQGQMAANLGLDGIPITAETSSLLQLIELANYTGCRIHFSQLSSARAVDILARARSDNPRISADVGIHHLFHTDRKLAGYNPLFHTIPPLREESDRQALAAGVNHGVIDCISSAHTPLHANAKLNPFPGTQPGISSLDSFIPQLVSLVRSGQLRQNAAIDAVSSKASTIFDHARNPIEFHVGSSVRITLIDPNVPVTLNLRDIVSIGKNNPMIDEPLHGRVEFTISCGQMYPSQYPLPNPES